MQFITNIAVHILVDNWILLIHLFANLFLNPVTVKARQFILKVGSSKQVIFHNIEAINYNFSRVTPCHVPLVRYHVIYLMLWRHRMTQEHEVSVQSEDEGLATGKGSSAACWLFIILCSTSFLDTVIVKNFEIIVTCNFKMSIGELKMYAPFLCP